MADLYQYVPAGGTVVAPGGPTPLTAGSIGTNSINSFTYGYNNVLGDDGFGGDYPHNWYKFVAPQSGDIYFATYLSYDLMGDTEPVYMDVYTGPPSATVAGLTHQASSTSTLSYTVTAGTTYWIRVGTNNAAGTKVMFLMVGDFGIVTDWIQGSDQVWTFTPTAGFPTSDGANYPRHLPPVSGISTTGYGAQHSNTFEGSYQFSQALGGPNPSDESATYEPAWRNARAGQAGGQYWSEDPTNPDIDIHASWHGGPGTPLLYDDGRSLPGTGLTHDTFVGINWGADKSFPPTTDSYEMYAHAWRFDVTSLTESVFNNASAGANNPTDFPVVTGGFSGNLEWQSTESTIVKLEAAPDDTTITANTNGTCKVYAKVVPEEDLDGWGPASYTLVDGVPNAGAWQGGLDLPDSFPAKQDVVLAETFFGSAPMVDITDLMAPAVAQEAVDAAGSHSGSLRGALRFVSIPLDALGAGTPGECPPDADADRTSGRNYQVIALRVTVRPAPHRWVGYPTLPDTVTEPVTGSIIGDVIDTRRRFT